MDRQKAIVSVILKFETEKQLKGLLRERYAKCTDISDDRRRVIDAYLREEYNKDAAVIESLWACVHQIENQISNKIRWSFEENVEAARVEQQQQHQGVSSSSAPRDVLQQPQLPDLNLPQPSYEENVAAGDGSWNF